MFKEGTSSLSPGALKDAREKLPVKSGNKKDASVWEPFLVRAH